MTDKRTSMAEAVRLVRDGDVLALGGLTLYRRPVAFVRQLLRLPQPPRDLTLLSFTGGFANDLLVGAGLADRVRTCYFGLEAFGLAPMFTQRASAGDLQVIEETESSLAIGLRANLAKVSFMPGLGWTGTDLPKVRPDVKLIDDPYGDGQYYAFPAIDCDVAVIHALQADWAGNAAIGVNQGVDVELSLVGKRVIITAEKVIERLQGQADTIQFTATAVVHAPKGAWPTSCHPLYPVDGFEMMRYVERCPADFDAYLAEFTQSDAKE